MKEIPLSLYERILVIGKLAKRFLGKIMTNVLRGGDIRVRINFIELDA